MKICGTPVRLDRNAIDAPSGENDGWPLAPTAALRATGSAIGSGAALAAAGASGPADATDPTDPTSPTSPTSPSETSDGGDIRFMCATIVRAARARNAIRSRARRRVHRLLAPAGVW
jgi:hypothetical protein